LSWNPQGKRKKGRPDILEARKEIEDQEDKEDLERSGENDLEVSERCGCRHMPPRGQKGEIKRLSENFPDHNKTDIDENGVLSLADPSMCFRDDKDMITILL
jgi:hypothetical protein